MFKSTITPVDVHVPTLNTTLSDVVEGILDVVARLLNTRLAVAARIESTTYMVMSVVDQHHTLRPGQMYNLHDTFCMQMLETGQPLVVSDTTQAPMPLRAIPGLLELDIRAYIGVPLYMADGRVFGSLWAADSVPRQFTDRDVALLQLFARLLVHEFDQDAQHRHSERMEQVRSMYESIDSLTGLLNRDSFEAALNRETARRNRYGSVCAVAVLRMAWPETTAERYDSHNRNTLRQVLADILMRTSRMVDYCARIDTNEFAVLFAETTVSGVNAWRKRIEAAIEAWNRVHITRDLILDVSIGVADCQDVPNWAGYSQTMLELAERRAQKALEQRSDEACGVEGAY